MKFSFFDLSVKQKKRIVKVLIENGIFNKDSGCYELLTNHFNSSGYGTIRFYDKESKKQRSFLTHRVSYEIFSQSKIPDNLIVMHSCDNRKCVNPIHLSLGTQKDNILDMYKKNRGKTRKGSKSNFSKLTEKQVEQIKKELKKKLLSHQKIAEIFGVSRSTISSINTDRSWKHMN